MLILNTLEMERNIKSFPELAPQIWYMKSNASGMKSGQLNTF